MTKIEKSEAMAVIKLLILQEKTPTETQREMAQLFIILPSIKIGVDNFKGCRTNVADLSSGRRPESATTAVQQK